jgi:hypothetical protein
LLGLPRVHSFVQNSPLGVEEENNVKLHTKRGGLIQNYEIGMEIDEVINLKKPRKLKIVKMIFVILKHFFGSMYFMFVLAFIYMMKKWYMKHSLRPDEIKGKFL